jgi:hypothetical protein
LKKKNRLKQSPGSQDIEVLKFAHFQGFFRRTAVRFFFIFVAVGGRIFPNKVTYIGSSHNFTQFQKKNQPKRSPGSEVMSILTSTVF